MKLNFNILQDYFNPSFDVLGVVRDDKGKVINTIASKKGKCPAGHRIVSENTYTKVLMDKVERRVIIQELKRI